MRPYKSRLSLSQTLEIKNLVLSNNHSFSFLNSLARRYGITVQTIRNIIKKDFGPVQSPVQPTGVMGLHMEAEGGEDNELVEYVEVDYDVDELKSWMISGIMDNFFIIQTVFDDITYIKLITHQTPWQHFYFYYNIFFIGRFRYIFAIA